MEILSLKCYFSAFLLKYSILKQKSMFFIYLRIDLSTLFVEKEDISTILLHNLILGGYLHQTGRYFHLMRIVIIRVEITTRFHQKPPLKQGG